MRIYVDSEYRCHVTNQDGVFREVEHEFFNNKCKDFIEGFCYDDSKGYLVIYSWRPYSVLEASQQEYEHQLLTDYESSLSEIETALGVTM